MQSLLTFVLVVFVALASGDPDCKTQVFNAGECCKVEDLFPNVKKTGNDICKLKHIVGKPIITSAQIMAAFSCLIECSFEKEGLLTSDKKLDKDAVFKFLAPTDSSLIPEMTPVLETCFNTYESEIDTNLKCKSGALQYLKCFKRETLHSCPGSRWTSTPECEDIKAKSAKCPDVPVLLIRAHH